MKTLITLALLASATLTQATVVPVNVRNSEKKLVKESKSLPTLLPSLAETRHFRVLKGATKDVVDFDRDETEAQKAATVLFHLEIARNFFMNELNSAFVASRPQLNIRLEMAKPFNENLHFVAESHHDEFNNALTVPASGNKALSSVDKWGVEIWFRPMKEIEIDNVVYRSADVIDKIDSSAILGPMVERSVSDAVVQAAIAESVSGVDYMGYLSQVLFTVGALEVFPKVMKFATKSIKSKAYLDTALIPEVIYHEFAHVALSDHVSIRKSTPLNEGMANYFAAVINESAKVAANNGKASKNVSAYNGKSKEMYNSLLETKASGQTNFVFSYLWRIRERFTKEFSGGGRLADKLIYNSRKHVQYAERPIKDDLVPALRAAIEETFGGGQSRQARMILNDVSLKAGL